MSTLTIIALMLLIYLYINQVSGREIYIANNEAIQRLSQANDTKHWNIYIDELLFHLKGLDNIEGRLLTSTQVVGRAMQWCQLPDGVGTRSGVLQHVSIGFHAGLWFGAWTCLLITGLTK